MITMSDEKKLSSKYIQWKNKRETAKEAEKIRKGILVVKYGSETDWQESLESNFIQDFNHSKETTCKKECESQCFNEPEPIKIRKAIDNAYNGCRSTYEAYYNPEVAKKPLEFCDKIKQRYERNYANILTPEFKANITTLTKKTTPKMYKEEGEE